MYRRGATRALDPGSVNFERISVLVEESVRVTRTLEEYAETWAVSPRDSPQPAAARARYYQNAPERTRVQLVSLETTREVTSHVSTK